MNGNFMRKSHTSMGMHAQQGQQTGTATTAMAVPIFATKLPY
jgi:hypothetical protein